MDSCWFSYVRIFIIHWIKFKLLTLDTNTYVKNVFNCHNFQKMVMFTCYQVKYRCFHIYFLSFQHLYLLNYCYYYSGHIPNNDQKVFRSFLKYNLFDKIYHTKKNYAHIFYNNNRLIKKGLNALQTDFYEQVNRESCVFNDYEV